MPTEHTKKKIDTAWFEMKSIVFSILSFFQFSVKYLIKSYLLNIQ